MKKKTMSYIIFALQPSFFKIFQIYMLIPFPSRIARQNRSKTNILKIFDISFKPEVWAWRGGGREYIVSVLVFLWTLFHDHENNHQLVFIFRADFRAIVDRDVGEYKLVHRLTYLHPNPPPGLRCNVRMAAQTFSR